MNRSTSLRRHWPSVLLVLATVALLAGLGYLAAWRQARQIETARASLLASALLRQLEVATTQAGQGFDEIRRYRGVVPCSPEHLRIMRQADIGAGFIALFGAFLDGGLYCSSLGVEDGTAVPLGPPDYILRNTRLWSQKSLPFADDVPVLILARGDLLAVIAKDLILSALPEEPGLSGMIVHPASGIVLAGRGGFDTGWLRVQTPGTLSSHMREGRIIAMATARDLEVTAAVAIAPPALAATVAALARWLVPGGAVLGLVIGLAAARLLRRRSSPEAELRLALRNRQLHLVYQPMIDQETGRWAGAEALLRWERPDGTSTAPAAFVAIAETGGLMAELTQEMLRLLANDLGPIHAASPVGFHMAFNIATPDLHDEATMDCIAALIEDLGIRRGYLTAEIREHSLLNPQTTYQHLLALQDLGVNVAIDDFGSGYSGLGLLESFRVDYIKIEPDFIRALNRTAAATTLVRNVVEIARSLAVGIVAEGVESAAQADALKALGVRYGQGWLHAPPLSATALLEGLKGQQAPAAADSLNPPPTGG